MNIKDKIGQRIRLARKKLPLSLEELANKIGTLSAARIGNWERGQRVPGPSEVMQLAKALRVSPAYLYCFSDDEEDDKHLLEFAQLKTIPILSLKETPEIQTRSVSEFTLENYDHLLVEDKTASKLNQDAFAIKLNDASMIPIFEDGDIIIINPHTVPQPGQYVVANLLSNDSAVFRKYREIGKDSHGNTEFELIPNNPDWPVIRSKDDTYCSILGVMVELRRYS